MAKETMIVFVYDTECLKDEADDPVNAVLYFHPSWVSDTQKVALCGQLMGTSYFLKDCFFKPRIMSLQNGKFVLKEFGRFILAVGTDRNISDYLLEHRANLLASLVHFFHCDIQTISDQFALQSQYKNLSEKLYHIFETYLPILQRNGNILQNVPKLRMPKTASNIFLDAIQTLQCCQQTKGVLGGAILYHNKVVASQLSHEVTKQLVLTDPLHIRTTAEQINSSSIDFHIPNGVQMLIVYVDVKQYANLKADSHRAQNLQTTQLSQGALPFQYAKRKMKRDKSLIFTNIPEEGSSTSSAFAEESGNAETISSLPPKRPNSLLMRPTHLPLRLKNSTSSKELPESGIASINFDETDSYPEFIGRTSVCSTPMTENKVLQVANIMSICADPEDESNSNKANNTNSKSSSARLVSNNRRNSLKKDFDKFFQHFIATNPNKQIERRNSFTDLQDSLKKISKKLSLKQFANNKTQNKTDVNRNGGNDAATEPDMLSPDYIGDDVDEEDSTSSDDNNKPTSRTITDPTYPVFNANGQPISRSLFQEFLERYYKLWGDEQDEQKKDAEIAQLIEQFKEFDNELQQLAATTTTNLKPDRNLNIEQIDLISNTAATQQNSANTQSSKPKTPMEKRAMSLPLKPLADITPADNGVGYALGYASQRKPSAGGVPLTPLMAKLSVLAMNEEQQRWDATPGAIEIQTPLTSSKLLPRRSSLKCEDAVDALSAFNSGSNSCRNGLQRAELYLCGQQNMTLLLLMEEGSAKQQEIVQKLFEICVARFPHMESQLSQTLNVNVEGDKREGGYSFVCLDSKWDALQRSGPWNPVELTTLESMHRDLVHDNSVTDLILRSHDSVYYGYKSGRTEIFYKEPAHPINGLPPPSDPLGNVAMKAKNQLERDYSYILF